MTSVLAGCEPWEKEGGPTGVLVVHGFTGSPQSVRHWAEGIAAAGHTVRLPRLPGHGTSIEDMRRTGPADWVGEAEAALKKLQARCQRVFVCGLSMGGTITYDLAERLGSGIAGVATVNASMFSRDPRVKLAPILGRLPIRLKGVADDIADRSQHELAYPRFYSSSAAQMLAFQAGVMAKLDQVRCPALIMVSRQDHVVHPDNSPHIFAHIATPQADKELVWLEKSFHVATLDHDKDLIVEKTVNFIAAH